MEEEEGGGELILSIKEEKNGRLGRMIG